MGEAAVISEGKRTRKMLQDACRSLSLCPMIPNVPANWFIKASTADFLCSGIRVVILVLGLIKKSLEHECSQKMDECYLCLQMKGCIKVLKDQPSTSTEGLLNALRYTTRHLNDDTTSKQIRALLQ
ncbi:hypothetical protein AB205_0023460 [Aquarana catesbeiana]|uniref:CYRIA/CYRIB Rac1 binding domain-containing protein n=1 Tax=Aquarana catesbeiana TaxID=8400 RepID=A0A2G9SAW8_AQUCT|nr:hypothetical protein AB205_0023460 [Aquarana catesbeiana]